MTSNQTILMRRMGMKAAKVKTGWFSSENRIVLDGELGDSEVLCVVRNDGTNARTVEVGKDGIFLEGKAPAENEMLFAVRRTPVPFFEMKISAGNDRDGFKWFFEIVGKLEITKPESFVSSFRGNEMPLDDATFSKALGTIPMTVLHDKVTMDVLGVMSLEDKGVDEQYADIRKSLEDWRSANEAFVTSAIDGVFTNYFNSEGVAKLPVSTFRARSQDREEYDKRKKIEDEQERINAAKKAEADKIAEEERKVNERKRAEEIAEEEHLNQLAVLRKRREALSGPRPQIWMKATIHEQGNMAKTRDCSLTTSGIYKAGAKVTGRPRNTIMVGDILDFKMRVNIDGWLNLYNYGTSGKLSLLIPNKRITANETYAIEEGGNLYNGLLSVDSKTLTTRQSGRLERFIAIITREPMRLDENSVKEVFDKRNPQKGFVGSRGFASVEEGIADETETPLEEAMASLVELPAEDWAQGTLELEVI